MAGLALTGTTVRRRLTLLYGGLILLSGAALLVTAYMLMANDGVRIPISTSLGGPFQNVAIRSGIALAILAIASMLLGWWAAAGRALRPLRAITSTTQRISDTNLHERLALGGPRDELTQLADTIDGLLERLESAFESQRRFVANASHELRTPLTTMRAMLDVASAKSERLRSCGRWARISVTSSTRPTGCLRASWRSRARNAASSVRARRSR